MLFWEIKNKKLLQHFISKNLKYMFIGPCDNVLLKVADPTSLGYLIKSQKDIVSSCVQLPDHMRKCELGYYGETKGGKIKVYEGVFGCLGDPRWVNTGSCWMRVSFLRELLENDKAME